MLPQAEATLAIVPTRCSECSLHAVTHLPDCVLPCFSMCRAACRAMLRGAHIPQPQASAQIVCHVAQAYQAAIARVVQKKKASAGSAHVVDLGTGCGVLAVMAAKAGADSVVACDIHESLCASARQVDSQLSPMAYNVCCEYCGVLTSAEVTLYFTVVISDDVATDRRHAAVCDASLRACVSHTPRAIAHNMNRADPPQAPT